MTLELKCGITYGRAQCSDKKSEYRVCGLALSTSDVCIKSVSLGNVKLKWIFAFI